MQRRQFLTLLGLAPLLIPFSQTVLAFSSKEFEAYKADQNTDFTDYKKRYHQAVASYKKELLKDWREAKLSSQKEFVRYSQQQKTRTSVDFSKETIVIEAHAETPKIAGERIKQALSELITLDTLKALKEDPIIALVDKPIASKPIVSQSIEDQESSYQENEKPQPFPIIADLYPEKDVAKILAPAKKELLIDKKPIAKVTIQLPSGTTKKKAEQFLLFAEKYAVKEGISAALVMSVIHTESYFNPMARSHVPAFGLMQIVPKSAGLDVTQYLEGKSRYLTPEELYQPEMNIQMGSAYLHLLYYRYMKAIKNEQSRFYCSIAGYNTGPGNVARAFVNSRNISAAADVINQRTPKQVYQELITYLPYGETRDYLQKVNKRIELYT